MNSKSEKITLDALDLAILRHLQTDGLATLDALAEATAMSSASVWWRIRSMEETGVIPRRVALVDPMRVGLALCAFADVSLQDHSPTHRNSFESFVQTAAEVMECHATSGGRDYLLKIRVADMAEYEAFLMGRLLAHPSVASASSGFALRDVKYTTALPL